jgi:hypothetical protein
MMLNGTAASAAAVLVDTPGFLSFETWSDITGTSMDALTSDPRYPDAPTFKSVTPAADTRPVYADDSHENYGGRLSGWLTPTATAAYDFFLRSDDAPQLWLSTDGNAANLVLIAEETGCCAAFQEPGDPRTTAAPIPLVAATRYWIQALWKVTKVQMERFSNIPARDVRKLEMPCAVSRLVNWRLLGLFPSPAGLFIRRDEASDATDINWHPGLMGLECSRDLLANPIHLAGLPAREQRRGHHQNKVAPFFDLGKKDTFQFARLASFHIHVGLDSSSLQAFGNEEGGFVAVRRAIADESARYREKGQGEGGRQLNGNDD